MNNIARNINVYKMHFITSENFERIKIGHGCGYIYNKEQIDDDNVIQHLLKQNENITNNIILHLHHQLL